MIFRKTGHRIYAYERNQKIYEGGLQSELFVINLTYSQRYHILLKFLIILREMLKIFIGRCPGKPVILYSKENMQLMEVTHS